MKRITKILLCVLCAVAAVLCVAAACFMLLKKQSGTTANSAASGASVSTYGKVSDFDYASFDYSEGLDDNGHWTGIRALDYVTLPEDSAVFSGAKVREYESTLQALQTMGDALTGSLQKQWAMEQRQREQIIQLSHKLKTPLTIIEGNAELLAEDDGLTAEQKAQVESILQGAEQTRTYLGKIRAEVQTPLRYKRNAEQ